VSWRNGSGAAVLDLGFAQLGLHRVTARMVAGNTASSRLCDRLGMRREAHFRRSERFKGAWTDVVIYALLEAEWKGPGRDRRPAEDLR
jgi:RimJ/RimL family protein N-acetyltransferase